MGRALSLIRNCFCGLLACAVIASGGVRRSRMRAFGPGVITPIYFHNPNGRLFKRCVRWLKEHGYQFISTAELIEILHGERPFPRGGVWLSIDDGFQELVNNVVPVIREYKVPVTIFLPTGIIEGDGLFPWLEGQRRGTRDAITLAQAKQIALCPQVTLGSHTVNHTVTAYLPTAKLHFELSECKHTLESWTGSTIDAFCFPKGHFDGKEEVLLRKLGYKLAATTEPAFITPDSDAFFVPRFCVGDQVSFPEAVCNMVGAWQPVIRRVKKLLRGWGSSRPWIQETPVTQHFTARGGSSNGN